MVVPTPKTATLDQVLNKSFDYIICGGGTAGLCLAARLTDDPNTSVLVLEAGDANLDDPAILRLATHGSHFGKPQYSWDHKTVPQKFSGGHEYIWPRGKGLGGSSAINFMCWTKPHASEFEDWAELGFPEWNWSEYQKYSHRTETFVYPDPEKQKQHNLELGAWKSGTEGPLMTAFPANIISAELELQQTLINCGLPVAPKPLDGDPTGVFFCPNTIDPKTHTRTYAATAFYLPFAHRSNLTVLCNAPVHQIITAQGAGGLLGKAVKFQHGSSVYEVAANKEIILSAGACKSPQILELSGIGDRAVLEALKIPVKLDLPVGKNVQEHIYCGISWELNENASFETLNLLLDPEVAAKHLELHASGEGMYTMGCIGLAFASLRSLCGSARFEEICANARQKIAENSAKYPPGVLQQLEIQLRRLKTGSPGCELISHPSVISGPNPPEPRKKYLTVLAAMNHCFSRGTIHSTSTDPESDPAFDPHYFEDQVDQDTMIEIIKFVRNLANVEPFKNLVARELNPGPEVVTEQQISDWAKLTLGTTFHTAGSASMLPRENGGVVDRELKVYGTQNIRVVDLSIVPLHIGAHTQATVYAIAEKAADIIKNTI